MLCGKMACFLMDMPGEYPNAFAMPEVFSSATKKPATMVITFNEKCQRWRGIAVFHSRATRLLREKVYGWRTACRRSHDPTIGNLGKLWKGIALTSQIDCRAGIAAEVEA